jgi:hypothetical protein
VNRWRTRAADLAIVFVCLLHLAVWWVVFLVAGGIAMFGKLKNAHHSKTILANAAVIVAALSGIVPALGPFLAPTVLAKAIAALAAANIALRTVTGTPLEQKTSLAD